MRRPLVLGVGIMVTLLAFAGSAAGAARLYMPSYGSGPPEVVAGFERGADGSLSPIAGSPFPAYPGPSFSVGGLYSLAFTPDGTRAVAGFYYDGSAQGLGLNSAGAVSIAGSTMVGAQATGLAVTPDGRFAYTPTGTFHTPAEGVRSYSIGAGGALSALPNATGTDEYGDAAITPDGRYLYVSDYTEGEIDRFVINADGSLVSPVPTGIGESSNQLAVSPDGRLLLVGIEGVSDGVASYSIGAGGGLTENGTPALTGDVALGYFAVAPDSGHLYMPDSNADAIITAAIAADGKLSVVGSTPILDPEAVAASPDGHFLYIYHRGSPIGIRTAAVGVDGVPTLLAAEVAWESGEPARLSFQPEPTPVASFKATAAAVGAVSKFNASQSVRAARYEWSFGDGTVLSDGGVAPGHAYAKPGVYEVRLTVLDQQGCSTRQIYTGQSTTCPGGPAATSTFSLDTPPAITGLKVSNRRFAVAAAKGKGAGSSRVKFGTAFRYTLSEAAKVRFKIDRKLPGRAVGGKCKPRSAANGKRKHCVRFKKASPPLNAKGKQGANKIPYSGRRKGGKTLPPGSYRATAVATDGAGGRSVPRYVSFKVVAG